MRVREESILKLVGPTVLCLTYFHPSLYLTPHLFSISLQQTPLLSTLFLPYFHSFYFHLPYFSPLYQIGINVKPILLVINSLYLKFSISSFLSDSTTIVSTKHMNHVSKVWLLSTNGRVFHIVDLGSQAYMTKFNPI